jgi:hypothetical protein
MAGKLVETVSGNCSNLDGFDAPKEKTVFGEPEKKTPTGISYQDIVMGRF